MRHRIVKRTYKKDDISFALLIFDNGDYIPVGGNEIDEISISLYDKLILENDELCAFAESGFLKVRIQEKPKMIYFDPLVYNPKQYKANRKTYLENRLSMEGGLKGIRFFDENNWHTTVFGNIVAKIEGNFMCLQFVPKPFVEAYESEEHTVYLNNIKKSLIRSIELDFENCESFTVYSNEILDIDLKLKDELAWSSHDYCRIVENGHITLKIDYKIGYRQMHFLDDYNRKVSRKTLERRLCGKKNSAIHDICHLYINYLYAGFGTRRRECLEIEDIKPDEEIEELERQEDETGIEHYYFEGGRCERQSDGSIMITFGNSAKK